ncbi:MAG: lytic murein transglycosylase, partial [Methylobacteriaceae bacterium]|nr:lytic murein transglycosylase [Methylobacteriaceae bacterium]
TLEDIEKVYQVPYPVVVGIWGLESSFDGFSGKKPIIRALATLVMHRYRGDFYREQLLEALLMIQHDNLDPKTMVGSWAGAMGQVQFMPSSYRKFAVDFDGDGVKNIWTSVPDALASVANYLREHGWNPDVPWGVEVKAPKGYNYRHDKLEFAEWKKLGFKRANGKALPKNGLARIFAPAGARGPVFLVTENFDVIRKFNFSDSYALGVALLGETLAGQKALTAEWPRKEKQMEAAERIEMQQHLRLLGYYDRVPDGKIGPFTREAVRRFQLQNNLVADAYPSVAMLEELRKAEKPMLRVAH